MLYDAHKTVKIENSFGIDSYNSRYLSDFRPDEFQAHDLFETKWSVTEVSDLLIEVSDNATTVSLLNVFVIKPIDCSPQAAGVARVKRDIGGVDAFVPFKRTDEASHQVKPLPGNFYWSKMDVSKSPTRLLDSRSPLAQPALPVRADSMSSMRSTEVV